LKAATHSGEGCHPLKWGMDIYNDAG
jgi:hypothetical protein